MIILNTFMSVLTGTYTFFCILWNYQLTLVFHWHSNCNEYLTFQNSVRHNLSLNKCFEKIEKPAGNSTQRKGYLWAMNPAKVEKMEEELQKWGSKDPVAIRKSMANPGDTKMMSFFLYNLWHIMILKCVAKILHSQYWPIMGGREILRFRGIFESIPRKKLKHSQRYLKILKEYTFNNSWMLLLLFFVNLKFKM